MRDFELGPRLPSSNRRLGIFWGGFRWLHESIPRFICLPTSMAYLLYHSILVCEIDEKLCGALAPVVFWPCGRE